MNKLKTGVTALAGSLMTLSVSAGEMAVTGTAEVTYTTNGAANTGNPYGMNTSLGFTGSGDVNGYETTLFMTMSDQMAGMSSASLAVDLGDMGTITFDQGVGVGGISTIDDKTPSANEEVWDGLDSGTGDSNGLVGGGNSGVFVYSNTLAGSNFSLQFGKGGSAANSDDATTAGTSGTSWDFALTNSSLVEGLDVGFGYGKIANASQDSAASGDDSNEHMTGYATYTMSGVSVGYQESIISDNTDGGVPEQATGWGISATVMEGLSVSYGEREIEFQNAGSAHVQEDQEGVAIAYTMGSAKISLQNNETSNNSGTANNNDEMTEIALSLSF